jgi:hypothetical protein
LRLEAGDLEDLWGQGCGHSGLEGACGHGHTGSYRLGQHRC